MLAMNLPCLPACLSACVSVRLPVCLVNWSSLCTKCHSINIPTDFALITNDPHDVFIRLSSRALEKTELGFTVILADANTC